MGDIVAQSDVFSPVTDPARRTLLDLLWKQEPIWENQACG